MTQLINYYPNPRFITSKPLPTLVGCTASYDSRYNPTANQHPGMTLTATRNGDNWAQYDVTLPAGMKIALAVGSIFSQSQSQSGVAAQLYNVDSWLGSVPVGWNKVSSEITVPSTGKLRVTFRAPKTTGDKCIIANVFLGTLNDYKQLKSFVSSPWFDGSVMPLTGGGSSLFVTLVSSLQSDWRLAA